MRGTRSQILNAAVSLHEFTAAELAACTTRSLRTVQRFLAAHPELFARAGTAGDQGRPAVLWRMRDAKGVLAEIEKGLK